MRVLLFANTDWYLYNFRLSLAAALRARGCEVVLVSPPGDYSRRLQEAGFRWIALPMSRRGINVLTELFNIVRLVWLYRRERPALVHHFTIKCVLYGSVAARVVRVPNIINAVTGLGYVFTDDRLRARVLRAVSRVFYRLALKETHVIFQNPEDQDRFASEGLLSARRSYIIRGSGVDVARFSPSGERIKAGRKRVLLAARLLWSKGVAEFVQAATLVQTAMPDVVFQVVGAGDPGNPDNIEETVIERWKKGAKVKFLGHREDMPNLLKQSDIVVLSSYYGEGIPRILVEAAACGLALVASDAPGCREVARQGVNGFLVPVKNPNALAEAILKILKDDALRAGMGAMSRKIACEEFSDERVISNTLETYREAGLPLSRDH